MTSSLKGKVAVVTGAGAGIGRGASRVLGERGAQLAIADIDERGTQRTASELMADGIEAVACRVDVAEEEQVMAMTRMALDCFGRLDILYNNAAVTSMEHLRHDLDVAQMEVATWDRTMAVNLRGTMLGCKHAVPLMITGGGGSIINTSSSSALRGDMGRSAYGTSKAAIIALTKYVAAQYGRDGVRCNAVIPRAASPEGRPPSLPVPVRDRMALLDLNLLGRSGTPDDVGRIVAFLASDESSWMTGGVLYAEGGAQSLQPWWSASRQAYEDER